MATKVPIACPVCREEMTYGKTLEDHLVYNHRKRKLAKFLITETVETEEDIS